MSAISTDGMDKWLDDAYPDLDRRKANMIYEIASLIKDDPDTAPVLMRSQWTLCLMNRLTTLKMSL